MKIIIEGKPKEIADFVSAIQSQQYKCKQSSIGLGESRLITNPITKDDCPRCNEYRTRRTNFCSNCGKQLNTNIIVKNYRVCNP